LSAYSAGVRLRILDKYLLREFAWPLLYSFDAFLLLFVVYDLLENLGEFLRQHAKASMILKYYLVILPEPIVLILPLAVLLGILFCLSMLGRHNELLAMRANGLSVWRLATPFFVAGVAASLLSFWVNENFAPKSRESAESLQRQMRGQPPTVKRMNFFFSNAEQKRDWYAREFDPTTGEMSAAEFHTQTADGKPAMDVYARRVTWVANRWQFESVRIVHPPAADVFVAATNFPFLKEDPNRMALESKQREEMTTTELRRFARALRGSGRGREAAAYSFEMHRRYAMPLTCLIVVWLGVPLGMQVSRRGPMMGIGLALGLVIAFFILSRLTAPIGTAGRIEPWVAAWIPNILFGAVGVGLFFRAR